jgi:hypothetical protein
MRRESELRAEYDVKLCDGEGAIIDAKFRCFDDSMANFDAPCRLVLTYQAEESLATSTDFFAALDEIRIQLELRHIFPLVNGVGLGRYPSGMARDMGSGLSIYRLRLGERATTGDLLKTFEADDLVEPATVKDQRAYYDRWLESLKG